MARASLARWRDSRETAGDPRRVRVGNPLEWPRYPHQPLFVKPPSDVPMPANDRLAAWCLPLFAMLATASILMHGPMPLFSTRTLGVAWEMWQAGSWLVPLHNGEPYSHKAPLLYWLIHLGWAVGGVGETWPKLLMVLLALANLALAAQLVRQLFPHLPEAARLAPWILAGSSFWFLYSLQIMFDLLVSACALICLIGLTRRGPSGEFKPSPWLVVAGLGLGLLAKGPVALLHGAFPLLLAPWWLAEAAAAPARWYRRVGLWVLAAIGVLALWVVPAVIFGGEAYRQELLFWQTAGRVVSAFDHAQPPWWYLTVLPVLMFPWFFWPPAWRAAGTRGQWADPSLRFLLIGMLPPLLAFSVISGKQIYYILPQFAVFAAWLAVVTVQRAQAGDTRPGTRVAAWPIIALGALFALLPWLVESGRVHSQVVADFAAVGPWFGLATIAIGGLLLLGARDAAAAIPRLGLAALVATALLHLQFTLVVWPRYDLAPVAAVLTEHEAQGGTIANRGVYEGQYHFLARLTAPVAEIDYHSGPGFAAENPDAMVVDYVKVERPADWPGPAPLFSRPFRGEWIEVWRAGDWLAAGQAYGPPTYRTE
jgi:4-amino-4-deoxy-L-arabinose transferase-like glycosyltransferase